MCNTGDDRSMCNDLKRKRPKMRGNYTLREQRHSILTSPRESTTQLCLV